MNPFAAPIDNRKMPEIHYTSSSQTHLAAYQNRFKKPNRTNQFLATILNLSGNQATVTIIPIMIGDCRFPISDLEQHSFPI
jgi:hypothetical protein